MGVFRKLCLEQKLEKYFILWKFLRVETDLAGNSSYRTYYETKRYLIKKPQCVEYFVESSTTSQFAFRRNFKPEYCLK
jgi:hypothetical protein